MKELSTINLGKELKKVIDDMFLSGDLEKKVVLRDTIDEVNINILRAKKQGRNFIWFKKTLTPREIQIIENMGCAVFNPRKGINYGKTWPGYQISW